LSVSNRASGYGLSFETRDREKEAAAPGSTSNPAVPLARIGLPQASRK